LKKRSWDLVGRGGGVITGDIFKLRHPSPSRLLRWILERSDKIKHQILPTVAGRRWTTVSKKKLKFISHASPVFG